MKLQDLRLDLRQARAQSLTYEVMRAIEQYVPYEDQRYAMRAILDLLMQEGVEVITDYHRERCGLPARDPKGWTIDEFVAYEKHRLDAMLALQQPIFVPAQAPGTAAAAPHDTPGSAG